MMKQIYTLNMYGQGVVTLPKAWRDRVKVDKFIASEEGDRLIIEPIKNQNQLKMITENPSFDFLKDEPDLYS